jgi:DNA-binding MltR family transcriptional regulator
VKIKDDKSQFSSFSSNSEQWNEVLNSSERNAVLIAGAAFDVLLERILQKYLRDDSKSTQLINGALGRFATRINTCFCLGLISEDELHDLNVIKEVRNSFAHNIFDCDFSNPEVSKIVSSMKLGEKANAQPNVAGTRVYFNICILTLESLLNTRLQSVTPVSTCANMKVNGN